MPLGACGGPDLEQIETCAQLIPTLDDRAVEIDGQIAAADEVTVHYHATEPGGASGPHWITCRFAGHGLQRDRLRITGVTTDQGELSAIQLYLLREFWLGRYQAQARAEGAESPPDAAPAALSGAAGGPRRHPRLHL